MDISSNLVTKESSPPSQDNHALLNDYDGPDRQNSLELSSLASNSLSDEDHLQESALPGPRGAAAADTSSNNTTIPRPKGRSAGPWMAFMNLTNSIVGAGVIGQPYAIKQSGLIGGTLMTILLAFVIDWTIRLIVRNAKMSSCKSYQATVNHCFGRVGSITISFFQCMFAFGGMIAYIVIVGDTIPHVMRSVFPSLESVPVLGLLVERHAVMIICVLSVSLPLSLNRHIGNLSAASAVALFSMTVIIGVVVFHSPTFSSSVPPEDKFTVPLLTVNSNILRGISVISFAYVCHHNSLIIYDSLKVPSMDVFGRVTHWSLIFSVVTFLLIGLGGFLSFKGATLGNILNNFPSDDVWANVARLCFGLNMLTTVPLELFVCREVTLSMFMSHGNNESQISEDPLYHEPVSTAKHVTVTAVYICGALIFALATCNLGVILEIVGSTSAAAMAYIGPPACYIKLSSKPRRKLILEYACIVFGSLLMVFSTIQTIVEAVIHPQGGCTS